VSILRSICYNLYIYFSVFVLKPSWYVH